MGRWVGGWTDAWAGSQFPLQRIVLLDNSTSDTLATSPLNTPPHKAVFEVFNANLGCWVLGTEFHPAAQASLKSLCSLPNAGATNMSNHTDDLKSFDATFDNP